jgi:tetratricopeptide (TPR) repeat protein
MKKIIAFVFLFLSLWANAQNEQLAQNYYDRGEFEKAVVSYEELLKNNPGNSLFFQRTVECYQQLQQFDKAEKALQARLEKFKQSNLLIELGYNYQLQKDEAKAKKYYEQAIDKIVKILNENHC